MTNTRQDFDLCRAKRVPGKLGWFSLVLLAVLLFLSRPVSAADGVSFLDKRDLTITLDPDAPTTLQVKVINASAQDIHLDLTPMINEHGAQAPAGALPQNLPLAATDVITGAVTPFTLTLRHVDGLAGSYAGQLVVYGDDGAVDRLNLTLAAKRATPAPPVPGSAVLEPDYLETATLLGVNYLPSPLAYFGLHRVKTPTLAVNETLSRTRAVVGSLSGGNGGLGQVLQDGATLRVRDITRAGEYEGRIDLLPDDQERGDVKLELQVRDWFLWPLLTLLLGLGLSFLLERYVKVSRPYQRLQINSRALQEQTLRSQAEAQQALPDDWPTSGQESSNRSRFAPAGSPDPAESGGLPNPPRAFRDPFSFGNILRIYEKEPEEKGLLAQATAEALAEFQAAQSDQERQKWGPGGEEFKRVQGYASALPQLHQLSLAAFAHYKSLQAMIPALHQGVNLERVPVLNQVRATIEPGLIMNAAQLQQRQKQLESASSFISDFADLLQRLAGLLKLALLPRHEARAEELLEKLLSDAIDSAAWLVELKADAMRLELDIKAAQIAGSTTEEISFLGGPATEAPQALFDMRLPAIDWPDLPDLKKLLGRLRRVQTAARTSDDLRRELRRQDRAFNLVSGCIVVLTGLSALYLGDANFGALHDYAGLLLWGAVLDEGFKLGRRLAPSLLGQL